MKHVSFPLGRGYLPQPDRERHKVIWNPPIQSTTVLMQSLLEPPLVIACQGQIFHSQEQNIFEAVTDER